ncbi:DUF305 domain-containing protein [Acrocarpospora phusangensis]|uniref:DUF305 domain-containing protein n=1 Tax=Acrocarpospora phusangensis TaxID=1070424 RepID=A0A919URH3_9ACTN|nr:DUF305 domain-containing protein [Acrocarpospora phusangensis]GIH27468.1 DUF305 domain-containing protein [Acrocarpospora phusangensis]
MRRYALLAALLLTGCGAVETPSAVNASDVMFLQMMVAHNQQGVGLAKLAEGRDVRPEVRTLAAAMGSTQSTEVQRMSRWLVEWDQPLTAAPDEHAHHGGMPETTKAELARLRDAPDADFESRLLNTMIAHQDDAIQLARYETGGGTNPGALELARQIDVSRKAQIDYMLGLLDSAPRKS